MWRCLNDIFLYCTEQEKWDKEAEEQRTINPDPNIKIVLRCEKEPHTCNCIYKPEPIKVELKSELRKVSLDMETAKELGLQLDGKKPKRTKKKEEVKDYEQTRFL